MIDPIRCELEWLRKSVVSKWDSLRTKRRNWYLFNERNVETYQYKWSCWMVLPCLVEDTIAMIRWIFAPPSQQCLIDGDGSSKNTDIVHRQPIRPIVILNSILSLGPGVLGVLGLHLKEGLHDFPLKTLIAERCSQHWSIGPFHFHTSE